jgi:hypothetical protein
VLVTLGHHFHSTIPEAILSRLLHPSRPSRPMRDHMLAQSSLNGREEFALLCSLQGLRPKIQYACALLFPSAQFMAQRYGLSSPIGLISSYIVRVRHLTWEGCKWAAAWLLAALATRQGRER